MKCIDLYTKFRLFNLNIEIDQYNATRVRSRNLNSKHTSSSECFLLSDFYIIKSTINAYCQLASEPKLNCTLEVESKAQRTDRYIILQPDFVLVLNVPQALEAT